MLSSFNRVHNLHWVYISSLNKYTFMYFKETYTFKINNALLNFWYKTM